MGAVKRTHRKSVEWQKLMTQVEHSGYGPTRAVRNKHNKLKRLYPNSIAPERPKVKWRISPIVGFITECANGSKITMNSRGMKIQDSKGIVIFDEWHNHKFGIDLASGKDQTGYGGRIID